MRGQNSETSFLAAEKHRPLSNRFPSALVYSCFVRITYIVNTGMFVWGHRCVLSSCRRCDSN